MLASVVVPASVAAAPVVVRIHHESTILGTDGVSRTERYDERLVRDGDQVWIERVLPAALPKATDLHDVDLHVAVRWFVRSGDGVRAALVSVPDELVVELEPASLDSFAIPARWVEAANLVDISSLEPGRAEDGARWYERRDAAATTRVLWDRALNLPRRVEIRSSNGRITTRMTVIRDTGDPRPWQRARRFRRIDRSDLGD
ncbi:MAG TPA: hypothetical protein VFQ53_27020 [Kofleriaceae bacterium]|nr:hypothetical protein [Kofleriaceae bacterium]